MKSVLVAALGHAWLRDQSFGMKVLDALRGCHLPPSVELEDWSFGTITAFQKLAQTPYRRAIFVSGVSREGRSPGTLARWSPVIDLPAPAEIQGRISDCVMGAVSVDTLLIMARLYGVLPDDVVLLEVEPVDDTWGSQLSPEVHRHLRRAVELVLAEVERPDVAPLSDSPLKPNPLVR